MRVVRDQFKLMHKIGSNPMSSSRRSARFRSSYFAHVFGFVLISCVVVLNLGTKLPFTLSAFEGDDSDGGSSSSSVSSAKDSRPLLLLHVGPHKTATNSIQCQLSHHHDVMRREANAAYLGRLYSGCLPRKDEPPTPSFDPRDLVECLDDHSADRPCPGSAMWRSAEKVLDELADAGRDLVIVSDEAFARLKRTKQSARLLRRLLAERFRVRVVVAYRRYHAWVVSVYAHTARSDLTKGRLPPQYKLRHVVVDGRMRLGNYEKYFFETHPAHWLADAYAEVFPDVVALDLHDDAHDHVMAKFFAHALRPDERGPGTDRALDAMLDYEPKRTNQGWDDDHVKLLSMLRAADAARLLRKDADENDLVDALRRRVDADGTYPHLDCLSAEEEEAFRTKSLAFETRLLESRYATTTNLSTETLRAREERHRSEFAAADHCSVDVDALVEDELWRTFFRSL